jgi:transposase
MTVANPSPQPVPLTLGIDVCKARLDLAYSDGHAPEPLAYDDAGLAALLEMLRGKPAGLVVVESTGGIERPLLDALLDAGVPVARVEPGRVRYFAKADATLAKTDAIDARVLACKAIDAVLATVDKQVDGLDRQIKKLIDSDDDFRDIDRILQSVPGVGIGLSAVVLSSFTELGTLGKRTSAALIGVAPYNCDSGKRSGARHIRGGRVDVRNAFYMSAYAATKFNPVLKAFAERLTAAGKPFKVVITACMRKLAGYLNVMLRDRITWDQLAVAKNATRG